MACKPNEIIINKSCSVKLTDDIYFIITAQYHTAEKGTNDKSFYHLAGKVFDLNDILNEIKDLSNDSNILKDWIWGDSRLNKYYISYNKKHNNDAKAKFLKNKILKAVSWNEFYTLATKGIKIVGGKHPREKFSESSKYELKNWISESGETFDIDSPETLIKYKGEYIIHYQPLKRELTEKLISELTK